MNQASLLHKAALSFGERPAVTAGLNSLYNYHQLSKRAARLGCTMANKLGLNKGEMGEIICRGDVIMAGYLDNPDATADTLRGGWLHTGDVGAFDEHGFLTLMDRAKDMIISGGSNIYPREVEEVLLRHDDVSECSVVGRQHADWGEEVIAFIVSANGTEIGKEKLDALCLDHIARFNRPKEYRFITALPKNNYGKVLKTELRSLLAAEQENG